MKMRIAAIALLLPMAGCAHVSQDDFDTRMGSMRTDLETRMDEGDQRVATRLGLRIDATQADLAALQADLIALESDLNVRIEHMEDAVRFNLPVYFGFDRDDVPATGNEVLARFSRVAEKWYPQATITVEGFADPSGSSAYNLRLGERRGESVKARLVGNGLSAERIRVVSYGEDPARQIADGRSGPGRSGWENRRVTLVIDFDGSVNGVVTDDQSASAGAVSGPNVASTAPTSGR